MKTIFDLGVCGGLDTYFYLNKGFNVVSVEANPNQCKVLTKIFEKEIQNKTLTLVNAIANDTNGEDVTFYKDNEFLPSSTANPQHKKVAHTHETFSGVTINYSELISRYGVPYYCKIDIESLDVSFLKSMDSHSLPTYTSAEMVSIDIIDQLHKLGYQKFKLINQFYGFTVQYRHEYFKRFDIGNPNFVCEGKPFSGKLPTWLNEHNLLEWSGLFGTELPGEWVSYDEIRQLYTEIHDMTHKWKDHVMVGWFDCHATM